MDREALLAWMWLTLFRLALTLFAGWFLALRILRLLRDATSVLRLLP